MSACYVDRAALWGCVDRMMRNHGYSSRTLAEELGIPASSLTRLKQGHMVGADALVTLLAWLALTSEDMTVCEWSDDANDGPVRRT